jgi:hypothetical protein
MGHSDSQRLQNDLTTLRMLLGSELPFEQFDVRGIFWAGVAALLPAITCAAGGRSGWLLLASGVPFLAVLGYFLVSNYRATDSGRPCPAAKRREYRVGLPIMLLSVPLVFGFVRWAVSAGAPAAVANGCVMLFLGALLLYQGLYEVGRRAALFVAAPSIVGGLLWPFISYFQLWIVLWLSVGLGMITAAAYMRWQLNSFQGREPAAARGEAVDGTD